VLDKAVRTIRFGLIDPVNPYLNIRELLIQLLKQPLGMCSGINQRPDLEHAPRSINQEGGTRGLTVHSPGAVLIANDVLRVGKECEGQRVALFESFM
jgi:hypothetical protein